MAGTPQPSSLFQGLPTIPLQDPSLTKPITQQVARGIRQSFLAVLQSEGAGAKVRRSIGTPRLRNFSPFLMLDHFGVPKGAGFPDHPHRGQETITYLISGGIDHEDFTGHQGTIGPGDLQFMTAGKGIMHAEMPHATGNDSHPNVGIQLWVDLPTSLKYCEPRYRDLKAGEIPIEKSDDGKVTIKVISGQTLNGTVSAQELSYTPVWFLDITIKPGGKMIQPLPLAWNCFAYSLQGAVTLGSTTTGQAFTIDQHHITVFEQAGDHVVAQVEPDALEDSRFILGAGMPLDQPVVQYGPFVMNTSDELYQAVQDFQTFSNGFERGQGWQSKIGQRRK